jgi:ABC-type amino acid transport system permease subunit
MASASAEIDDGMMPTQSLQVVILPQAARIVLPPLPSPPSHVVDAG